MTTKHPTVRSGERSRETTMASPTTAMRQGPLVSVVIAAYNVQDCLGRAVESVLAQELQDFEILVVDDGSRDATLTVARQLADGDGRIRVFALGVNQGPAAARNRGIAEARGEWVSILDADDVFEPARLRQLMELAQRRNADMVGDDLVLYDAGADQRLPPAFGWTHEQELTLDALLANAGSADSRPLGWVQPVWRAAFLRAHGLAYPVQYRYMEDFFLLASTLLCGARAWLSPHPGYVYTLRHGPISQQASKFSATRPGTHDARAVCEELIARFRGTLRHEQVRILRNIHRRMKRSTALAKASATRRERGLLAALVVLRGHPGAAWQMAMGSVRGLWHRFAA